MRTNNLHKAVLGMAFFLFCGAVSADIVFDPKNFAKNLVTSAQAVKQTAIELNQYATMVNQYKTMLQNVKQLTPEMVAKGIARGVLPPGTYNDINSVINASNGIYSVTQGLQTNMVGMKGVYDRYGTMMGDMNREMLATNLSYEALLQYDYERAKQGVIENRNYYSQLQQMSGQLQNYQTRQDALAEQIPQNSGMVEMLGTIALQNNLTQDQMSHMIQVSTMTASKQLEQLDRQSNDTLKETAMEEKSKKINKAYDDYFNR